MPDSVLSMLFPDNPRPLRYRRWWLNILRALHILCFSVYLGGLYAAQPFLDLDNWFIGILVTGLAMMVIDLYSSCILLFEVRGIAVLVKILLLLCLPVLDTSNQLWLLMLLVVFSSLVSHSTRKIRHKNLLPRVWLQALGIADPATISSKY